MKIWARVGVVFDVDDVVYQTDPQMAILEALYRGKATLNGETYIPGADGVAHTAFDNEISFDFVNVPIKA